MNNLRDIRIFLGLVPKESPSTKNINTLYGQKVERLSVKHGGSYDNYRATKV